MATIVDAFVLTFAEVESLEQTLCIDLAETTVAGPYTGAIFTQVHRSTLFTIIAGTYHRQEVAISATGVADAIGTRVVIVTVVEHTRRAVSGQAGVLCGAGVSIFTGRAIGKIDQAACTRRRIAERFTAGVVCQWARDDGFCVQFAFAAYTAEGS